MKRVDRLSVEEIRRCFSVGEDGVVRWKDSVDPCKPNTRYLFDNTVAGRLLPPSKTGVRYIGIRYTP